MGRLNLANQTTPATPSAGATEIFVDSADKLAKQIDDTGAVKIFGINMSTNLGSAAATSGTTETLLHKATIAANSVKIGDTFNIILSGVSSSTGTLIFRVRVGATGTTGDAQAWVSTTSAAQAANAWGTMQVLLTVRSIGVGTVQASGVSFAGAVVLPQLAGAAATASVTTTATWYVDICVTCSVGTFTAHNAIIELLK